MPLPTPRLPALARLLLLLAVLVTSPGSDVLAQVVRGTITEVRSAAPVSGVLVSLVSPTSDSAYANVLTNARGEYAIRAPSAGAYRLTAKRIGVRRHVTAPFTLGDGETRSLDLVVDAIAMALPEVMVSGLCVTRDRELARASSLWDEVRTALAATGITLRDQLARTSIMRYAAELEPGTLAPLFDWRSDFEVLTDRPFTSPSGDSLSLNGYWRVLPGDSVEFLAPDADALGSNAFLRDHCFSLAGTIRERPGLVGLAFEPARERTLPDIDGTIWLDARTFELKFVAFRYTQLPRTSDAGQLGGEVHFRRLPDGAWIVDRWFIRMPQEVIHGDGHATRQLREEGGVIVAEGDTSAAGSAAVSGIVRDSAGRPVAGAVVRAIGVAGHVLSAADGSYTIDGLPAGPVSLVVRTDGYDSHALLAGQRRLGLRAGQVARVDLRAPNGRVMAEAVCTESSSRRNMATLRLVVADSATLTPLPGAALVATWSAPLPGTLRERDYSRQVMADNRGAATFCFLPSGVPITVSLVLDTRTLVPVMTELFDPNTVVARVVTIRGAR